MIEILTLHLLSIDDFKKLKLLLSLIPPEDVENWSQGGGLIVEYCHLSQIDDPNELERKKEFIVSTLDQLVVSDLSFLKDPYFNHLSRDCVISLSVLSQILLKS